MQEGRTARRRASRLKKVRSDYFHLPACKPTAHAPYDIVKRSGPLYSTFCQIRAHLVGGDGVAKFVCSIFLHCQSPLRGELKLEQWLFRPLHR